MDLFKLTIAPHASERDRETTTSEGPFIVAAKDMARARALVAFNFSIAAMRRLGAGVWTDAGPHEVIRLNGVKEDDLRQKMIVAGTDISQWYLDRAVLKEGRRVMARMVWWPCRDGDRCPVQRPFPNAHGENAALAAAMSPPNQINEWLQRAIVHWLRGQLRMESCPYAIQPMANGSFVVVKVVATSQASLPGRDVKLNSFRGSFATRDEAEREVERLMASRRLTEAQRVA